MGKRREFEFPPDIKRQLRKEAGNRCAHCHQIHKDLQVHHKIPISRGGTNDLHNAQCLCPKCHERMDKRALHKGRKQGGNGRGTSQRNVFSRYKLYP